MLVAHSAEVDHRVSFEIVWIHWEGWEVIFEINLTIADKLVD